MGWEYRAGGGPYYVRRRKVNRKDVRTYFGKGLNAERAAAEDALKQAEKNARKAELEQLKALDMQGVELEKLVRLLMNAALVAQGYYQYHRQWRKRRGNL